MEFRIFVAITIGILQLTVNAVNCAAAQPAQPLEDASLNDRAPRLVNIGTVDGKSYFADRSISRNWTTAKTYCQSLGMELATIMTSTQIAFLKSAHNSTTFYDFHWIAARDSFEERQYSWDNTEAAVTSLSSMPFYLGASRYQTCLAYYAHTTTPSIYIYQCEQTGVYTLCET